MYDQLAKYARLTRDLSIIIAVLVGVDGLKSFSEGRLVLLAVQTTLLLYYLCCAWKENRLAEFYDARERRNAMKR